MAKGMVKRTKSVDAPNGLTIFDYFDDLKLGDRFKVGGDAYTFRAHVINGAKRTEWIEAFDSDGAYRAFRVEDVRVPTTNGHAPVTKDRALSEAKATTAKATKKARTTSVRNKAGDVKGVSWHRGMGKYTAKAPVDGKRKYLGAFDNKADAEKAVLEARKES